MQYLLNNAIIFFFGLSFGIFIDNDSPHLSSHLFDKMHMDLYKIANEPVITTRKLYHLGAVKRSGGGLDDSDRELVGKLYHNASSILEFGLGESTHIAAYVGVPRYFGIDTDATWVGNARKGTMAHFRFAFSDIGSTLSFGNPADNTLKKIPVNSQSSPLNNEMEAFDFYMVDGRYRVSCACASFLHAMSRGGDMSLVLVAVHDWTHRPSYWIIKEVAEIVHKSNNLAVMKIKTTATEDDVFKIWENHIWDQR